ncbi:hypothetical protein SeMB42_g02458 [Synchytrium endobioticum]|uniref:CID domain-containing protein n=1 Tax=Synchytrium endobioticum TaxID=286115 RepID=A0A507DF28_9FUNG|nr:hypothetical protein SeMB42_g02458 [Synchytrium endobioticum]
MAAIDEFEDELRTLLDSKPPVSLSKMQSLIRLGMKHSQHYREVVAAVEKFGQTCPKEYKLPTLYVVDAVGRAALRAGNQEAFIRRFEERLESMFQYLAQAEGKDKDKMKRVVSLWKTNGLFNPDMLSNIEQVFLSGQPLAPPASYASPGASPYTPTATAINLGAAFGSATPEQTAAVAQLTQLQAQNPGADITTLVGMMGPNAAHLAIVAAQSSNQTSTSSTSSTSANNNNASNGLGSKPTETRGGSADQDQPLDFDYEEVEEAPSQRARQVKPMQPSASATGRQRAWKPISATAGGLPPSAQPPMAPVPVAPPIIPQHTPMQQSPMQTAPMRGPVLDPQTAEAQALAAAGLPPGPYVGPKTVDITNWDGDGTAPPRPDPSLAPNILRVISRTIYVGGITTAITRERLKAVFETAGRVDTVMVNYPKFNAFVKMCTRREAEHAKDTLNRVMVEGSILKMGWGCGFGPKPCFDYNLGESFLPIDTLSEMDIKWLMSSRRGGGTMEGGMVIEEPDVGYVPPSGQQGGPSAAAMFRARQGMHQAHGSNSMPMGNSNHGTHGGDSYRPSGGYQHQQGYGSDYGSQYDQYQTGQGSGNGQYYDNYGESAYGGQPQGGGYARGGKRGHDGSSWSGGGQDKRGRYQ